MKAALHEYPLFGVVVVLSVSIGGAGEFKVYYEHQRGRGFVSGSAEVDRRGKATPSVSAVFLHKFTRLRSKSDSEAGTFVSQPRTPGSLTFNLSPWLLSNSESCKFRTFK